MKRAMVLLSALCAATVLAATALAPAQSLTTAPVRLVAELDGQNEVPDRGDPNGSGTARVRVWRPLRKVCFYITYERILAPTAGHIHKGVTGVAGPIKVRLFESAAGRASPIRGCERDVPRDLIRRIVRRPRRFYVNLHNSEYPEGAVRGQLVKRQLTRP